MELSIGVDLVPTICPRNLDLAQKYHPKLGWLFLLLFTY